MYREQVRIDGRKRLRMVAEALQLRVVTIATGIPAQHSLGEQRLTPEGYQPLRVQVSRVQ